MHGWNLEKQTNWVSFLRLRIGFKKVSNQEKEALWWEREQKSLLDIMLIDFIGRQLVDLTHHSFHIVWFKLNLTYHPMHEVGHQTYATVYMGLFRFYRLLQGEHRLILSNWVVHTTQIDNVNVYTSKQWFP